VFICLENDDYDDVTWEIQKEQQNHTKKQNGNELFVVINTLIIFRASSSVFTTSPYHQNATTTKGITE